MMLVTPVMTTPVAGQPPPPPAVAYSYKSTPSNAPLPQYDKKEDLSDRSNSPQTDSRKSYSKEPIEPCHLNQIRPNPATAPAPFMPS
ncbi:hypothetical protein Aduo_005530 [Ancylostoma duodenale]